MRRQFPGFPIAVLLVLVAVGCGRDPSRQVAVVGDALEVRGTSISASPAPLDFGAVVGGAQRTLTVANAGDAPLTISSIAFCPTVPTSPEFTLTPPVTPLVLAPGASAGVTVTYAVADFSATDTGCIRIASDDATQPILDVAISADGITQTQARSCANCHGNNAFPLRQPVWTAPAPPRPAFGSVTTPTTDPQVGAHQEHIRSNIARPNPNPLSLPIHCKHCHLYPPPDAPQNLTTHQLDGVTIAWSALVTGNGALTPAYPGPVPGTPTCSNVYCHGATLSGGTNTAPIWNRVDGTQATCGSCHGVPPLDVPPHSPGLATCDGCHGTGYSPTTVNAETHVDGVLNVAGGACTACHGDENRTPAEIAPAPPLDTAGNTVSAAVGAHQSHLTGTTLRESPVVCTDCHAYPPAQPHPSGATEFAWSDLARDRLPDPSYDPATGTCNIYCHGVTLSGGTIPRPNWAIVDGSQAACGTCHGLPPLTPHPDNTNCGNCHPGYTSSTVAKATHINALLELNLDCNSCHGDPGRAPAPVTNQDITAAPPVDTAGNSATTFRGVGAHQSHLAGTTLKSVPVPCADCHIVPASTSHSNGTVELQFGPGLGGTFDPASLSCSSVYCHGGGLPPEAGGTNRTPSWTTVDGTQAACGTCHDAPPTGVPPHFAGMATCSGCHTGYTPVSVNKLTHINGAIDVAPLNCSSCHGTPGRPPAPVTGADIAAAPPVDARGNSATTFRGVGAHQSHLTGTSLTAAPAACTSCHVVPTSMSHANGTADLALVSGTFSGATLTCSGVSCHGGALPAAAGGTNRTPSWTTVDGTQATCGTCHDVPPAAVPPHFAGMTSCDGCHTGYSPTAVNKATHINGAIDVAPLTCSSCHGTSGRPPAPVTGADIAAAPPVDTRGNSATTARGVGAHQSHLAGTTLTAAPQPCTSCHVVPTSMSHSNGTPDLALVSGAFDPGTLTCSGVSCHGGALPAAAGGTNRTPVWTTVDGTQAACGACHDVPPIHVPPHNAGLTVCDGCHPGYSLTAVNKDTHINGIIDAEGSCTACHGDPDRTPEAIAPAPPLDTLGNSATTFPGVGAHQAHLAGRTYSDGILCSDCHTVPTDTSHITGTAELPFGPLANTGNVGPVYVDGSCANTYCHGATMRDGTTPRPAWTLQSGLACNACHGIAPNTGMHRDYHTEYSCGTCHPGYTSTQANPALHVNGMKDIQLPFGGTWDPVRQWCSRACHDQEPWDDARGPGAAGPVTSITTSNPSATALTVSWSAAVNAANYELQRDTVSTFSSSSLVTTTLSGTVTTTNVTGLAAATTYFFRVRAIGTTFTPGDYSPTASGTTSAGITPGTPSSVTASSPTSNGMTVSWSSASDAASYELQRDTASTFGSPSLVTTTGITGTSVGVTGLAASTTYYFRVRAVSSTGTAGGYSPTASGTTTATPAGPVISATPNPLDFGAVSRYTTRTLTLTVRNTGSSTLQVTNVSRCSGTSSEYSVSSSGFSVSPGGTRSVSVSYRPTDWGTDTGCIQLSNNDPARNPYRVDVTGSRSGGSG